jgi:hypothetical protein
MTSTNITTLPLGAFLTAAYGPDGNLDARSQCRSPDKNAQEANAGS